MKLSVLFDLDDTLLILKDSFFSEYMVLLADTLKSVHQDVFNHAMKQAVTALAVKDLPEKSLKEVFDENFYPAIGATPESLSDILTEFYTHEFRFLQGTAVHNPDAIALMNWTIAKGFDVAIATNPYFPQIATSQRLDWANLSGSDISYHCVSTYEFFHFTKPNPAYFAEMLGYLGWQKQPAVMLGDSLMNDVIGPEKLGIPGFHVTRVPVQREKANPYSSSGSLIDALSWIEKLSGTDFENDFTSPDAVLAILKSTPAVLDTWIRYESQEDLENRSLKGGLTFKETVCLLRDLDRENLRQIRRSLQAETPSFSEVNTNGWIRERNYQQEDIRQAWQGFLEVRTEMIQILQLPSSGIGDHPNSLSVCDSRLLKDFLLQITQHDRKHIHDLYRLLCDIHGSAVLNYMKCVNSCK